MAAHKDYYRILQVDPGAEPEVIQAAYRRLARKYHPDTGQGDARRMQELNEAYAVLSDPARRRAYDRRRTHRSAVSPVPTEPLLRPHTLLRTVLPTLAVLLFLAVFVLDVLRLGVRGMPELTLLLLLLAALAYRFGGLDEWFRP
ncbi:MAG: J domain-containing protein [Caldilineae bacterium]|nr:MAG: J domain-containing protein [Caldilineae bacterium]